MFQQLPLAIVLALALALAQGNRAGLRGDRDFVDILPLNIQQSLGQVVVLLLLCVPPQTSDDDQLDGQKATQRGFYIHRLKLLYLANTSR